MKSCLRNRKAVSPVIAALLLIAISVAAAVITYSWVMTMIDTQGKQSQTSIRVEDVMLDQYTVSTTIFDGVKVTIRNSGSVSAMIKTIYLYRGDTLAAKAETLEDDYVILPGESGEIGVTSPGATWASLTKLGSDPAAGTGVKVAVAFNEPLKEGRVYTVRVVTDIGFSVQYTQTSPKTFTGTLPT